MAPIVREKKCIVRAGRLITLHFLATALTGCTLLVAKSYAALQVFSGV